MGQRRRGQRRYVPGRRDRTTAEPRPRVRRPGSYRSSGQSDHSRWRALIMEKMPYRHELDGHVTLQAIVSQPEVGHAISTDWREGLPVLGGAQVTLRELRASDAPSLFAMLT